MTNLLVFKEKLKNFYSKNDYFLLPIMKFLLVFITIIMLNLKIGFMVQLKNTAIVLIIALISSFIPLSLTVLILAAVIIGHLYALSMELAAITVIIFIIMFLGYYRFTPKDGVVLIATPVLFMLNIPYLIPIAVGLIATPVSIVSVTFGTIIYYIIHFVTNNTEMINNISDGNTLVKVSMLLESLLNSKQMYLHIVAFAIVVVAVYVIRRRSIDHAWSIAIITGGIANLVILLFGDILLRIEGVSSIGVLIAGTIASMVIATILEFCVFSVDYSRSEHVQFEDDEYYYYVKAVPKISVTAPEVSVKRINARRSRRIKN